MLSISPVDLGIVGAVALVVLGPEKLPGAARKGARAWREFNGLRARLEDEMRGGLDHLGVSELTAGAAKGRRAILGLGGLGSAVAAYAGGDQASAIHTTAAARSGLGYIGGGNIANSTEPVGRVGPVGGSMEVGARQDDPICN